MHRNQFCTYITIMMPHIGVLTIYGFVERSILEKVASHQILTMAMTCAKSQLHQGIIDWIPQ